MSVHVLRCLPTTRRILPIDWTGEGGDIYPRDRLHDGALVRAELALEDGRPGKDQRLTHQRQWSNTDCVYLHFASDRSVSTFSIRHFGHRIGAMPVLE